MIRSVARPHLWLCFLLVVPGCAGDSGPQATASAQLEIRGKSAANVEVLLVGIKGEGSPVLISGITDESGKTKLRMAGRDDAMVVSGKYQVVLRDLNAISQQKWDPNYPNEEPELKVADRPRFSDSFQSSESSALPTIELRPGDQSLQITLDPRKRIAEAVVTASAAG